MGVLGGRCSEGGFRTVQGKSVKEIRHLISGQPRAGRCSPGSLSPHHGRQGQGLKHVQGSYQLTTIQAPVSPHNDSSADVASAGREGVHQGEGGGLEPVGFPAVIPPRPSAPCQQGQHRHGEREAEELSALLLKLRHVEPDGPGQLLSGSCLTSLLL